MSKKLDTAATITMATAGTLAAATTWVQSTGLIDCSLNKHGLNAELKATFADNAAVEGDLTFYVVGSNDGGTDITSEAQACPIATFTPVQNTEVITIAKVPVEFDDLVGFAVKNEDATYSVTSISCSYKTVTL